MRGEQRLSGLKCVALGVNIVRRVTPIFQTTHELFIERTRGVYLRLLIHICAATNALIGVYGVRPTTSNITPLRNRPDADD